MSLESLIIAVALPAQVGNVMSGCQEVLRLKVINYVVHQRTNKRSRTEGKEEGPQEGREERMRE